MRDVYDVAVLDDPAQLLAEAGTFLEGRPTRHHVHLTVIDDRVRTGTPGRYWIVREGPDVVGVAMQTPLFFRLSLTPMPADAARVLASFIAQHDGDVPGLEGEADAAAAFAGTWSDIRKIGIAPERGTRIRELGTLTLPSGVPGHMRPAEARDASTLVRFLEAFARGVGEPALPEEHVLRRIQAGLGAVWELEGDVVSFVGRTPAVAGVVRLAPVYTPPAQRNRGFAGACVGAVSAQMVAEGHRCILSTDLSNPASNAVYRNLGYVAIAEVTRYAFDVSNANALP